MHTVCCVLVLMFSLAYTRGNIRYRSDEFINEINSKQSLWKAGKNFDDSMTLENLRKRLGLVQIPTDGLPKLQLPVEDVPESFDAREYWPDCSSIKEISDQSDCGSCWAVSVANAMSDRICIASGGKKNQIRISAKNLMCCCQECGNGCSGGNNYNAWKYWEDTGITTGGAYNSSVGCQPYPFAPCRHNSGEGDYPKCPDDGYPTPECSNKCDVESEPYELSFGQNTTYLIDELSFQLQIMNYGPISAGFNVFEDFLAYKSGIYQHTTEDMVGMHAVRVIGWGVDNGVKYWLVANSWNEEWGENGLFRMIRGVNDCNFEVMANCAIPKL